MPELLIYTPDGKKKPVQLDGRRITLGRSESADICFPEDSSLSRLHVAFERGADGFYVDDLKSKNGTVVNGSRVAERVLLKPNDKISCGHLLIVFESRRSTSAVVFVNEETNTDDRTIFTSLGGVMNEAKKESGPASHISALIRAGNELASERPLPDLFRVILDLSIEAVSASRGLLLTFENGELVEQASSGDESFQISNAVRDRVLENHLSVLVRDTSVDEAFRQRKSIISGNVRTLMAAPLQTRDRVVGLIYVDAPSMRREFTKDDLKLLTVMANVATIRIENARLAEIEQARKLLAYELEQAESIQRQALPANAPAVKGLDIAGLSAASRTVGGDYYDFFTDDAGRAALLVADVSGKGLGAALMVMAFQARVQSLFQTLPTLPGALAAAMNRLNVLTSANCPSAKFITVFACVVDGKTGMVDWASAGHNPSIVVRANGGYEVLTGGGPVMGMFENLVYPQDRAQLQPGDLLAIYSDGVTEACSASGDEFDIPELAKSLIAHRHRSAQEIIDEVMHCVHAWTGHAPPADDITLVIAKRTA